MLWLEVLAFESPSLDLDITLFIQLGIFVLLLLFLRKFVLAPYFRAYDAREALTDGAREDAKAMNEKALEAKTSYEAERQRAYAQAESARREEVAKANEEASKIIAAARDKVQQELSEKQASLNMELNGARRKAGAEVETISAQIANKILV